MAELVHHRPALRGGLVLPRPRQGCRCRLAAACSKACRRCVGAAADRRRRRGSAPVARAGVRPAQRRRAHGACRPKCAAFLKLVIENGRLAALPEVAAQFHALKNAAEGTADCVIDTAFALERGTARRPRGAGSQASFRMRLKPQMRIEPGLIGGVRVTVGDDVLDSSRARPAGRDARAADRLKSMLRSPKCNSILPKSAN